MIFVTVGTTLPFDELIQELDRLVAAGEIEEEVFAQIGAGTYTPSHFKWCKFVPDLTPYYDAADLVICHGGVGTVFDLMLRAKPFVAVPNKIGQDNHQTDLLRALDARGWCRVCYDVTDLGQVMRQEDSRAAYQSRPVLPSRIWGDLLADCASGGPAPPAAPGGAEA